MVDFAVSWSVPPGQIILHCMSMNYYRTIIQSLTALATNIKGDKWPGSTVGLVYCVFDFLQTYKGSHRKLWFRKERGQQKEHEPYVHCSQLQYNTGFAMSHESWLTKWRSTCSSSCTFCSCNLRNFLPYAKHCSIPAEDDGKIELCIKKNCIAKSLIAALLYWEVPDQVL